MGQIMMTIYVPLHVCRTPSFPQHLFQFPEWEPVHACFPSLITCHHLALGPAAGPCDNAASLAQGSKEVQSLWQELEREWYAPCSMSTLSPGHPRCLACALHDPMSESHEKMFLMFSIQKSPHHRGSKPGLSEEGWTGKTLTFQRSCMVSPFVLSSPSQTLLLSAWENKQILQTHLRQGDTQEHNQPIRQPDPNTDHVFLTLYY